MIPLWKKMLRGYTGGIPLKAWIVMTVGMQYQVQIPRLAMRHLDLLVKWSRDHIPAFRIALPRPYESDQEGQRDELEALEAPPLEPDVSLEDIFPADHRDAEQGNALRVGGREDEDPFALASEFPDVIPNLTRIDDPEPGFWV
jgi:hypothetical protein